VLLAKTKNQDAAPFEWVIDANPQDIDMTDFVRPDGTRVPITMGDYRQLADALFHAGANSGSEFEYEDTPNRLHFYILDMRRDARGLLSYTVAIRSLDGAGPYPRGVRVNTTVGHEGADGLNTCSFPVANTGRIAPPAGQHPEDVTPYLGGDVYRLSATVDGQGWSTWLPNELTSARFGSTVQVPVYAKQDAPGSRLVRVNLTATSESDPSFAGADPHSDLDRRHRGEHPAGAGGTGHHRVHPDRPPHRRHRRDLRGDHPSDAPGTHGGLDPRRPGGRWLGQLLAPQGLRANRPAHGDRHGRVNHPDLDRRRGRARTPASSCPSRC
jgi:hypothetical protein